MDEVLLGSLYEACIRCGQAPLHVMKRLRSHCQVKQLLKYVQKLREDEIPFHSVSRRFCPFMACWPPEVLWHLMFSS